MNQWNDGQYHAFVTLCLAFPSMALGFVVNGAPGAFFLGVGCLLGVVISPDLDQQTVTFSEWVWTKIPIIGWLMTGVWFTLWLPYAMMFKHRGLSHAPIFGTFTRVFYLGLIFVAIDSIWWHIVITPIEVEIVTQLVIGLMISDIGHFARDMITSARHRRGGKE